MSLIEKPRKRQPKDPVSIRMEAEVKKLLDEYCSFIECGRQHVVKQALLYTFEQDADFQQWREHKQVRSAAAKHKHDVE
jgi:hypothetical protein